MRLMHGEEMMDHRIIMEEDRVTTMVIAINQ